MFKYQKKLIVSLFVVLGLFSLFIEATPIAPGPYIGVSAIEGSDTSARINFLDNSNDEDGFRIFDGVSINENISANDETQHSQVYKNLTGLICNHLYTIQVVAHKDGVDSVTSDIRDFNLHTTFELPCPTEVGTASGLVTHALTANGLDAVTLNIREGEDTKVGGIFRTVETITDGTYSVELPAGIYTVEVIKDGFIIAYFRMLSVVDEVTANQNFSISPLISDGDMRIILTWGEIPRDLDSHLVRKTNGVEDYHLYYRSQNHIDANLDRDDRNSFGPETTTITTPSIASVYTFYLHNFTSDNNLKNSNAQVNVLFNNTQSTFTVPNEDGIYWKVFDVVNGTIIPCVTNCVQNNTSFIE